MHLNEKDFLTVIASTPLVSIDLVLRSPAGRILLGLRQNEPAKGFWFVPGGRIQKAETLPVAFQRICQGELDREFAFDEAKLLGAFTHIYDTNGLNAPDVATHYVVLAYEIEVSEEWAPENLSQHSQWKWCARQEADATVHSNVLPYFKEGGK